MAFDGICFFAFTIWHNICSTIFNYSNMLYLGRYLHQYERFVAATGLDCITLPFQLVQLNNVMASVNTQLWDLHRRAVCRIEKTSKQSFLQAIQLHWKSFWTLKSISHHRLPQSSVESRIICVTMPEVPKASLGPCPLAPHLNEDPNSAETPEQDAFSPTNEDVVSVQSNHLKSIPFYSRSHWIYYLQ